MKVKLFDTLSRSYKDLESSQYRSESLNLYVCGPTVYNLIHIGNARTLLLFDVFVRFLRQGGFRVNYVRNITDVDDKIIQAALTEKLTPIQLADKYTDAFHQDVDQLRLIRPDTSPRVTQHMPEIVSAVSALIHNQHAYQLPDGIYYDVTTFKKYGALSRKKQEDLIRGVRVDLTDKKRNPGDFALWKFSKPGEPVWDAPFGAGRPGWHIECSVMSMKYAPGGLHIHGGGVDLIHPHHENEIAQSEAIDSSHPFCELWMHVGFLNIGKEKMSKSLSNFIQLRQLLTYFHPEVLRLFLLSGHYRSPLDFGLEKLIELHHSLWRFYTQKQEMKTVLNEIKGSGMDPQKNPIAQVLADDFNTAKAVGLIFELFKKSYKAFRASGVTEAHKQDLAYIFQLAPVLGVFALEGQTFFEESEAILLKQVKFSKTEIEAKIKARHGARQAKDYPTSDTIRKELESLHIHLQDLEDGKVSWCLVPQFD